VVRRAVHLHGRTQTQQTQYSTCVIHKVDGKIVVTLLGSTVSPSLVLTGTPLLSAVRYSPTIKPSLPVGAACAVSLWQLSTHSREHARILLDRCLQRYLYVTWDVETLPWMKGKSVMGRLQSLKMTSLLVVLLGRTCFSVALIADDSPTRRHPSSCDNSDHQQDHVGGPGRAEPRQVRWATAAHEHVLAVDCQRAGATFATPRECSDVQRVDRRRWNVYLADPQLPLSTEDRRRRRLHLRTVLPDGPLGDHHRVDGVVALDPYPDANFGHLVIVFHVTIAASASWCQRRDGVLIGKQSSDDDDDDCRP